jgi:hypothetical protein
MKSDDDEEEVAGLNSKSCNSMASSWLLIFAIITLVEI